MKKEKLEHLITAIEAGLYTCNKKGNVFSWHKRQTKKLTPKKAGKAGYKNITICHGGKQEVVYVHHIVWVFFNRAFNHELQINHKNLNKSDNRLKNLEAITRKENCEHAKKNHAYGANRSLTYMEFKKLMRLKEAGKRVREIATHFNMTPSNVYHIGWGDTYKHFHARLKKLNQDLEN